MDYGGETSFSGDVGQMITEIRGNSVEDLIPGLNDQGIRATENDYGVWNGDVAALSHSNYDGRNSQTRSGSEPPQKRSRNSEGSLQGNGFGRGRSGYQVNCTKLASGNRSKVVGKMFFKTKLCFNFRAGTCPYNTNCNFAHGTEELQKPPPDWQEIVADQAQSSEPRKEHQIPSVSSLGLGRESRRSHKKRHCTKFYTDEGCPYGDMCKFLHDEQSKARERVVINLGPTSGSGGMGKQGFVTNGS